MVSNDLRKQGINDSQNDVHSICPRYGLSSFKKHFMALEGKLSRELAY